MTDNIVVSSANTKTYTIAAWTTLSGSKPSGNVQILVFENGKGGNEGHWLTAQELMALDLDVDDFVVTTDGTKYTALPSTDKDVPSVRYIVYDNTVGGDTNMYGKGVLKVHYNVSDLKLGSTISIAALGGAECDIVVG